MIEDGSMPGEDELHLLLHLFDAPWKSLLKVCRDGTPPFIKIPNLVLESTLYRHVLCIYIKKRWVQTLHDLNCRIPEAWF